MKPRIETLETDEFRARHGVIAQELHEISDELNRARAESFTWRAAAPSFRRLLVLLEVDIARQTDEEEHVLYGRIRECAGVMSPTLSACYREHRDIRVATEELHHQLLSYFAADQAVPGALYDRASEIIDLVRIHMSREDEVLFLAAEQELPKSELAKLV